MLCDAKSNPVISNNILTSNNIGIELKTSVDMKLNANSISGSADAGILCHGVQKNEITKHVFD